MRTSCEHDFVLCVSAIFLDPAEAPLDWNLSRVASVGQLAAYNSTAATQDEFILLRASAWPA